MQDFPHHYEVGARLDEPTADVVVRASGLPDLATAPPVEFDGPGDRWSPETLLLAAVCDCFVLGFKIIAGASRLTWSALNVRVSGTLDRVDRKTRFTHIAIVAELTVPAEQAARAPRILEKAESNCLVVNSLNAVVNLESKIVVG
jgi:organic hydroperoxide reductase OsmC/OhrA